MNITFKDIHIENFCGVISFECDFSKKTQISGKNRLGKSTIKNAIYWVLYNKMADGSAADGIRPHDESGKDIDFIEISVLLNMDIDGKDISIKKTQKQNWVKDRATLEQKFKGNVNEYEVNGIPKKEKDFTEYIENYIPMSVFSLCTNPMVFLSLDTKKRRAKLCEMLKDFTDADVINTDTDNFAGLSSDLEDGTIDELITRSKQTKSKLEQHLKELPTRIDEVSKQKVDIDFSELELQKNALNELISENKEKQNALLSNTDKFNKLNSEIMKLQFAKNDAVRDANIEIVNDRRKKESDFYELQKIADNISRKIDHIRDCIDGSKAQLQKHETDMKLFRKEWKEESERKFDDASLVCPTCGQEYPSEKKAELKASFEKAKEDKIADIQNKGNICKGEITRLKEIIKNDEEQLNGLTSEYKDVCEKIVSAKESLVNYKITLSEKEVPECKKIDKQILALKKEIESIPDVSSEMATLKDEETTLRSSLNDVISRLAMSSRNDEIESRIEELTSDQKATAQKILMEQAMLDKLELFRRTKMHMLSEKINQFFDVIKWQMFQEQINGGFADVCVPLVGGTSYDGTLNHGDKILAEIDICRAFQKANNVVAPIMADDTESLDSWRVPVVDNQLILFRRTDDEVINVEVLE